MRNRSGTLHTTLIVPECRVIGPAAADRVIEFLRGGGTAVFVGRAPERFGGLLAATHPLGELLAQAAPSASVGRGRLVRVTSPEEAVARSREPMPIAPTEPCPSLRLSGAQVDGAQVWLVTNEAETSVEAWLRFAGECAAEEWDLESGTARPAIARTEARATLVRLRLPGEGSRVLVVAPGRATGRGEPTAFPELTVLDGDWTWTFAADGATHTGPLVPWSEVGRPEYSGEVRYEVSFDLASVPRGAAVLDLGDVRHMVDVSLNGALVGRRLWPPYALDVTGLLREGRNTLEVRVTNTPANRFFARAEDRKRAEEAGWFEGTYVGTYERFEGDSLRSGLLGPVRVMGETGPPGG
jgi:hypothetical protein